MVDNNTNSLHTLADFEFIDLYVCLKGGLPPHYHKKTLGENTGADSDVPNKYLATTERLSTYLLNLDFEHETGLTFEKVRLRATKIQTAGGYIWAAMRRVNDEPPALEKLGFMPALTPHLRNLGQQSGLILLCGATGQGKTTTACSLLADFLHNHGGVAYTIEDPAEYALEGRHNNHGYCYQTEIEHDDEWEVKLKRGLRWHPRYILVGEIRTPEAANQLLRAATSGHLVLTTMHAGSIEEALEGLLQLAEQAVGERAPTLLSSSLAAVIYQKHTIHGLESRFYITGHHKHSSAFANCIREKKIGLLSTFIDQQASLLLATGNIFRN